MEYAGECRAVMGSGASWASASWIMNFALHLLRGFTCSHTCGQEKTRSVESFRNFRNLKLIWKNNQGPSPLVKVEKHALASKKAIPLLKMRGMKLWFTDSLVLQQVRCREFCCTSEEQVPRSARQLECMEGMAVWFNWRIGLSFQQDMPRLAPARFMWTSTTMSWLGSTPNDSGPQNDSLAARSCRLLLP